MSARAACPGWLYPACLPCSQRRRRSDWSRLDLMRGPRRLTGATATGPSSTGSCRCRQHCSTTSGSLRRSNRPRQSCSLRATHQRNQDCCSPRCAKTRLLNKAQTWRDGAQLGGGRLRGGAGTVRLALAAGGVAAMNGARLHRASCGHAAGTPGSRRPNRRRCSHTRTRTQATHQTDGDSASGISK